MFLTVLRIRDVYPGPDFSIPDQEGTGSRIPDPGPKSGFFSNPYPDPGSKGLKKAQDSGSQIRIHNTGFHGTVARQELT
jgi:hypothetical protein